MNPAADPKHKTVRATKNVGTDGRFDWKRVRPQDTGGTSMDGGSSW